MVGFAKGADPIDEADLAVYKLVLGSFGFSKKWRSMEYEAIL